MAGFRWFQVVSGWFQVLSNGFRSFLVLVGTDYNIIAQLRKHRIQMCYGYNQTK